MIKKISCKQVQAIMPFYLKGSINPVLCEIIEEHLEICDKCKEYYLKAIENLDSTENNINIPSKVLSFEQDFKTKEYQNFKQKLSAYFDSELEDNENIKMKKLTISNPLARKDLEDMYSFKRLLHSSFDRTKDSCKFDFSKQIIKKISDSGSSYTDNLIKIGYFLLFLSIVTAIGIFK